MLCLQNYNNKIKQIQCMTGFYGMGGSFNPIRQRRAPEYHSSSWNGRENCKYLRDLELIYFCGSFTPYLSLFPVLQVSC